MPAQKVVEKFSHKVAILYTELVSSHIMVAIYVYRSLKCWYIHAGLVLIWSEQVKQGGDS